MKNSKNFTTITLISLIILAAVLFTWKAPAGELEPTSPPGSTMHTLDEIYANTLKSNQVSSSVIVPPEAAAARTGKSYLLIEGVDGEATEKDRENWIDIFGYSYELNQMPRDLGGAGGVTGRTDFSTITFVKQIDKTSPTLTFYCAKGERIPHVYIETTELTEEDPPRVLLRIELKKVMITRIAPRFVYTGNGYVMVEEFSFNFDEIKWIYNAYDNHGGQETNEKEWDLVANSGA